MHKAILGLSLLTTLVVAGVTVHLHIRAHLRTYELARARGELVHLEEACEARRLRVASLWTPERVHRLATILRQARADRLNAASKASTQL
jgi:hypothetical protein